MAKNIWVEVAEASGEPVAVDAVDNFTNPVIRFAVTDVHFENLLTALFSDSFPFTEKILFDIPGYKLLCSEMSASELCEFLKGFENIDF